MLRVSRAITQEALADAIGVSNSQVSHIERGERDVDTELLAKIADALGVSPAELFEGERPTPPVPSSVRDAGNVYFVMPGKISAEERERVEELLKRLAEIPNGDKDLIYDLINTVYKRSKSK
jgi:transcriptional regulator with XRE-family HTH domain